MPAEMKRIRELLDALEPLALAYERFIKARFKEPHEVYFMLSCEGGPGPDMHIPGETVMAAANCWRELKGRLNCDESLSINVPWITWVFVGLPNLIGLWMLFHSADGILLGTLLISITAVALMMLLSIAYSLQKIQQCTSCGSALP